MPRKQKRYEIKRPEVSTLEGSRPDGRAPSLLVTIDLGKGEEERSSSTGEFQQAMQALGPGRIKGVNIAVRDSQQGQLGLQLNFTRSRPAARLEVQGIDRVDVEGVNAELARVIAEGRAWPPGPNAVVGFLVGGLFGIGLATLFSNLDWSWLPGGAVGQIMGGLVFFAAYGCLILVLTLGIPWFLPWFELLSAGQQPRLQQAKAKLIAGAGIAVAAVITALATKPFD